MGRILRGPVLFGSIGAFEPIPNVLLPQSDGIGCAILGRALLGINHLLSEKYLAEKRFSTAPKADPKYLKEFQIEIF